MDIKEMIQKRSDLERLIKSQIIKFELETGVKISRSEIIRHTLTSEIDGLVFDETIDVRLTIRI